MTTLEIVLMIGIGLIFPGIWYLQKRLNDIERDYANRNEIKNELHNLKKDVENDLNEIKAILRAMRWQAQEHSHD